MKRILSVMAFLAAAFGVAAQTFHNLTAEEVRIDSVLPVFTHRHHIGAAYSDSAYTVAIEYPEFVEMGHGDISRLRAITAERFPELPEISSVVTVDRKTGWLDISFVPVVERSGKLMKLVSFKLAVAARAVRKGRKASPETPQQRYASKSVLAEGQWVKLRVPHSGVYAITGELVRKAGFKNPDKVKIYGYGGALQPEVLTADYLAATDDLKEVAQCVAGGRRLIYARGPVAWTAPTARVRNPYSDYGCYLMTESEAEPLTVDSATFVAELAGAGERHNTLYEVDNFAWYEGGRNLYDAEALRKNQPVDYALKAANTASDGTAAGQLRVVMTAAGGGTVEVALNDSVVGTVAVPDSGSYNVANVKIKAFEVHNIKADNKITLKQTAGNTMHLDYISLYNDVPEAMPRLSSATFPTPEFMYRITNQNLHGDPQTDMVIVVPPTLALMEQAERLKKIHEEHDGLRVRIVPADEIYNEFSSGTPDATALKRYMKMLYDRAQTEADMPKYLLLMGDCAWDNRLHLKGWGKLTQNDLLLCFEGENSLSKTETYISDDFFCLLDDEEKIEQREGSLLRYFGKPDVAVGRFPVVTAAQAKVMVDKVEAYYANKTPGAWQNIVLFLGDDGDNNIHMNDINRVAGMVESSYPDFDVRRVMWDAYNCVASSTGNSYPEVVSLIKGYMADGALVINYMGHGAPSSMSHEYVLTVNDFANAVSTRLPLWVTASCDIMPFDGNVENIGEQAVLNPHGGAVAFYGTTRTVFTTSNYLMNNAFTRELLKDNASANSIGEAMRLAKNFLVTDSRQGDRTSNKLHYALLGDPALKLHSLQKGVVLDSINGVEVKEGHNMQLKAGQEVRLSGRITKDGADDSSFDGLITATVRDAIQTIRGNNNDGKSDTAFVFRDRKATIYQGTDSIRQGRFTINFAVPKDINYSEELGQLRFFALAADGKRTCSGKSESVFFDGSVDDVLDKQGPSMFCYLNSPMFMDGGVTNARPFFVAELSDESGINASGLGVGHDMQLSVDGKNETTYLLNDYFTYDFGSYRSGKVEFSLPELPEGKHTLRFRSWDILNNSSVSELTFNVTRGVQPAVSVYCTKNPAVHSTTFMISHDRRGADMDVVVDVFDMSGRHLWSHSESGVSTDAVYPVEWDLTIDGGRPLGTGVYVYRVGVSCEGSSYSTDAKKLIVISNK